MFSKKVNIAVGTVVAGIALACGASPGQSGVSGQVINRYGKPSGGSHLWYLVVRSYDTHKDSTINVPLATYTKCDIGQEYPTCAG